MKVGIYDLEMVVCYAPLNGYNERTRYEFWKKNMQNSK